MLRYVIGGLGICLIAAILVAGFTAYFIIRTPGDGVILDGFGRQLYPAPWVLRLAGIPDWPGLFWWIADTVMFWTSVGLAALMVSFGFGEND